MELPGAEGQAVEQPQATMAPPMAPPADETTEATMTPQEQAAAAAEAAAVAVRVLRQHPVNLNLASNDLYYSQDTLDAVADMAITQPLDFRAGDRLQSCIMALVDSARRLAPARLLGPGAD